MAGGSSLSDRELAALGVSRQSTEYGYVYTVPCVICGIEITTRNFSTCKTYKCKLCKDEVIKNRKAKAKAAREAHERALAEEAGIDRRHYVRFEKGAEKFGLEYYMDVERARTVIERFDSIPEVIACIELLHIGARVIAHQKVGDFTVDFCLPDEKVVVEIDGSLYHKDPDRRFIRDNALCHMLGDGWTIRHIPADDVAKHHEEFGRSMRRMLNRKREELGLRKLPKPML